MLKRFIKYYKPHKKIFIADMLASLLVAAIGVIYPIITRTAIKTFQVGNASVEFILICGGTLLGLYVLRMLLNYFVQYYGHYMGVQMQAEMRTDLFRRLEELPYSFYDNNETGKIMTRITSDLFDVSELAHHGPENLIISSITVIGSFIYLATIDFWLTLIIFCCAPIIFVVTLLTRKKMKKAFKSRRESNAVINAAVESSISGVRVTKAFNNSDIELQKFETGNEAFKKASKDAYKAMAEFHSLNSFVSDIFNVIVLIAGGLFLYNTSIDVADYSAFMVSMGLLITPFMTLINFTEQYQNGVSGFERFIEIMDESPEKDIDGAIDLTDVSGEIEFKNVTYAYGDGKDVLSDVSFKIKQGETFALVGSSGGGKTTICHLIPRFYDTKQGEILIDGQKISDVTMKSLRQNIGIVQQDIYLFNASIKDNILYGSPTATDEEVIEAAKRANIHEYVLSLPDGYDTVIGERGVKLSGGQKQRLSIARVFLKNPPILILDEATSALDNVTETLIQQSLDELAKGRTTIVVAHRLSTIKNADEIAVVSDGKIVEKGTHAELVALNGEYADLYNRQFRKSDCFE